jgi:hypothetical protein
MYQQMFRKRGGGLKGGIVAHLGFGQNTVINSQTARARSFLFTVTTISRSNILLLHHGSPKDSVGSYSFYFQLAAEAQHCISMVV